MAVAMWSRIKFSHRKRQKILDNQKQTEAESEGADQADVKYFLPQVVTEFDYWRK
jgi:hypothetical protein